jgi:hypothetical protein
MIAEGQSDAKHPGTWKVDFQKIVLKTLHSLSLDIVSSLSDCHYIRTLGFYIL